MADVIADIVGSGRTLGLHNLVAFGASLCDSEAILIERADTEPDPARDQLAARVQGVVFGQQYLMLDYDCPRAVLDQATAVTPGLESPTIAPLADPDWVAVRALVPRREVNSIMDRLAAIGAKRSWLLISGSADSDSPGHTDTERVSVPGMTVVVVLLLALLIGVVAGLRALTPPAVVAWAGALGWISLDGTWRIG